ncbi:Actin-like protein 7B [Heterocephalus glaber]|uniref:Actin-like protein 7B n=1 Tax=Heterocephalus glaber TaxID=10181 RepID=G5BZX8_HETGA|nr:Actin-like protein 7B [Heterocephalus glaber]
MEATKKVGDHDPSGPQGYPSASSQELGGGLRGSQGPWISSESLNFKQGLSSSTKTIPDEACGPASQASIPEPTHQVHQDLTQLSSSCSDMQASQDAPKLSSASLFPSRIVGAQQDLIMDDGTLNLAVCMHSNSTSDMNQHGSCCSPIQVQLEGEGKAKVLVGWEHAQEHKVVGRQVPSEQPENLAEKPLVYTSRPDTPKPGPEPPGTPKSQRNNQKICSSQPDKQPPNVCKSICSNVPLSANQVTCHKQLPPQSSREAMQMPSSSASTCQLQEGIEDWVLVFDMAMGNTRMGLLCHDTMGSQAVLVGLKPRQPSVCPPENILSTQPLARPILSHASDHSSFWSTTAMLSSPVPSSRSSGSYREAALVPKEARLNLKSQNSPGTETPTRVGMLTGHVPLGTPLQFGEEIQAHFRDPSLSKPDVKENEFSRTIWMLKSSPDASKVQTKKLQYMNSTSPASIQLVPISLLQQGVGSHNQKDDITTHSDKPQAEDAEQAPLTDQTFHNGQNLLARQLPVTEQGLLTGHPPSTRQSPLTSQPPFSEQTPPTGQPPLAIELSFTEETPFTQKPPIIKEPTISRRPFTSEEPGQPSTQEGESLGLPTDVGVLQVPLTPKETCNYVNRGKVDTGSTQNPSMHQLSSWQPGSCLRVQEEQPSLITFTTLGTGCKVLPVAMVGTEHQSGNHFNVTAEDIVHSSVVAHLGPLHGACYELVSTMDTLPSRSSVLCYHASGPYQDMAAVVIDTGMGFTKCGLAGEDHVLTVVPSQVQLLQHSAQGRPRNMEAELVYTQAPVDFRLPDKQVITLGSERFCCPEALFQPNLLGLNQPGLPQLALLSISRLETKQQEQLLASVVLDGGSTLLSGFPERLRQELGPGATVLGSPHHAVAAWLGGSIMAWRDSFKSLWLSHHEYEEEGPWAIYKYQL